MKLFTNKNKILRNEYESKISAFTIVETLITLLAISIMIAGPVAFVHKSYQYQAFIRQKIIATGLSEEAIELATSLRNYNLSQFQSFANACNTSCYIDWNGTSPTPTYGTCTGVGCRLSIVQDGSYDSYRHLLGTDSDFYRYVKVTQNGTQSYTVDATTYSDFNAANLNVTLRKVIFNIQIK